MIKYAKVNTVGKQYLNQHVLKPETRTTTKSYHEFPELRTYETCKVIIDQMQTQSCKNMNRSETKK